MVNKTTKPAVGARPTRNRTIFLLPVLLIVGFLCLKLASPKYYLILTQEDHVVEYTQSLFYLLASVFAFIVAVRLFKRNRTISFILYLLLSTGLLLIFLEEISWGQRLFGITTPDFFAEHNFQKEISLHNLDLLQFRHDSICILVGLCGAFAWMLTPRTTRLYRNTLIRLFVPSAGFMFYFLPISVIHLCMHATVRIMHEYRPEDISAIWFFFDNKDQEPAELIFALGAFVFMLVNSRRVGPLVDRLGQAQAEASQVATRKRRLSRVKRSRPSMNTGN